MQRCVVDVLSPIANCDSIPESKSTCLLVPETFIPTDQIVMFYTQVHDIYSALGEGAFYIRVINEFERALMLGIIIGRYPNTILCTSRPEIIKKYSIRIETMLYKERWPKNNHQYDLSVSTEPSISDLSFFIPKEDIKSSRVAMIMEKDSTGQNSLQERYIDTVYYEILNKYVEKFLTAEDIRATKVKSGKAQMKNLADGAVISVKRKALKGTTDGLPSSSEFCEMVWDDLVRHRIISEVGSQISYDDVLVDVYFGRNKSREFRPTFKEVRSGPAVIQTPQVLHIPIMSPEEKKLYVLNQSKLIFKEIAFEVNHQKPNNIGEVVIIIRSKISEKRLSNESIHSDAEEDIIKSSIKSLFSWDQILLSNNNNSERQEWITSNYRNCFSEPITIGNDNN